MRRIVLAAVLLSAASASAQPPPFVPDAGASAAAEVDAGAAGTGATTAPSEPELEPIPEEHRPRLDLSVDPRSGTMTGDLVTVTIRANVPEGDDVAVPRQSFAPFEVHQTNARVEEARGGRRTFVLTIKLLAFEPGDHTVGPIRLRIVTKDGVIGGAETRPIPIRVGSLLGNEPNAQPKPPTRPHQVFEKDYTLLWILGGLGAIALVALITLLLARWWMKRAKAAAPPPPPRPAWEVALEKLEALRREQKQMLADGRVVVWVDGVSDALREYLGHRYGFEGLESTTDEIVSRLRKTRLAGVTVPEIAAILADCDLVKFAKATLDEAQCDQVLAGAFRIVRTTMAQPAQPPAPGPGAPPPAARPPAAAAPPTAGGVT